MNLILMSLDAILKWGNLQNWVELDFIPRRLQFTFLPGNNHTIEVYFEVSKPWLVEKFIQRHHFFDHSTLPRPSSQSSELLTLVNTRHVNKHEYPCITTNHVRCSSGRFFERRRLTAG